MKKKIKLKSIKCLHSFSILLFIFFLLTNTSFSKNNLSDYYSSYIFIKNCNELDSFMYIDNESFQNAKKSIKIIERQYKNKNPNLDTDAEWDKAVKDWNDEFKGTFSMLKSFNTYNEEIAGYCKLQLFLLNGVASENKKNNIEKDF